MKELQITSSRIVVSANSLNEKGYIAHHELRGILPGWFWFTQRYPTQGIRLSRCERPYDSRIRGRDLEKNPVPCWCRVELGPSPDEQMPDGVLLTAFNAFDRYRKEITYITGYANEIRNRPYASPSPPIWVWNYANPLPYHSALARIQRGELVP